MDEAIKEENVLLLESAWVERPFWRFFWTVGSVVMMGGSEGVRCCVPKILFFFP